jgi:hypothetical protein
MATVTISLAIGKSFTYLIIVRHSSPSLSFSKAKFVATMVEWYPDQVATFVFYEALHSGCTKDLQSRGTRRSLLSHF